MPLLTPGSTTAQRPVSPGVCRQLGGCMGDGWCLYCDAPMTSGDLPAAPLTPTHTDAQGEPA